MGKLMYMDEEYASNGVDYVVDQGVSGIWTYRKWNSGIAECWGAQTWTITSWSSWGSWYYSTASPGANFPSGLFISAPILTASGRTNNGDVGIYWRSSTAISKDAAPTFSLMRAATGVNNVTGYLYMHAVGQWK